jgi:hypothetical protein
VLLSICQVLGKKVFEYGNGVGGTSLFVADSIHSSVFCDCDEPLFKVVCSWVLSSPCNIVAVCIARII